MARMLEHNKIICGEAGEVLKTMPAESINCCISSPPFWALRDYGTATWEGGSLDCTHILENKSRGDGDRKSCQPRGKYLTRDICKRCGAKRIDKQLGLEKTFEEYIDKLCGIYDEVKRVLRKDGTCFVNIGTTLQDKCDQAIPERFAIEMINRGWIKRRTIIWHKPNPMPSSVKDDFTSDFEYVYFFVKSNETLSWVRPDGVVMSKQPDYKSGEQGLDWQWGLRKGKRVKLSLWKGYCYFFEPIYEPMNYPERKYNPDTSNQKCAAIDNRLQKGLHDGREQYGNPALGRNKRTVWTIPTQSFADAHFATFPEKLVEPMILAGCPKEVCSKCGQGRRKVYETDYRIDGGRPKGQEAKAAGCDDNNFKSMDFAHGHVQHHFKGYTDCGCNAEWTPGVVLDPFWEVVLSARSLPGTDETGLELNSNRNISKWQNAA